MLLYFHRHRPNRLHYRRSHCHLYRRCRHRVLHRRFVRSLSSSSPKISRKKRKEQQTHLSEETTRLVHPRVISVLSEVEFVVGRQFCMVLAAYPLNMFLRHTKQYICISDLPGHYQQTREEESCKTGPDLLRSPFWVIPRADLLPSARGWPGCSCSCLSPMRSR